MKDASTDINKLVELHKNPEKKQKTIGLYHVVYENENFEEAASTLFGLVANAQKKSPNAERILYLDIDGHRNSNGGFDRDMLELQKEYMLGFLMNYLKEVHLPLIDAINTKEQRNNIPEEFRILSSDREKLDFLKEMEGNTIYYDNCH